MASMLETEIHEQPDVLHRLLQEESGKVKTIAGKIHQRFAYVMIAARGTSDNAARYAQYLFGIHNRLPVALAAPSIFTLYNSPPDLSSALVIGISQSGQSPDIVAVLEQGRRCGQPAIAITNDPLSPLAEAAEFVIELHAGPEKAVAATKTYTASLAAVALLSSYLGENAEHLKQLQQVPDLARQCLENSLALLTRIERYRYTEHCAVIGRGLNYCTAFEISLKITELSRILAEPYSSADFLHGPIAMVREGFPVILVASKGRVMEDMHRMAEALHERRAELIVISNEGSLLERARLPFPLPEDCAEWLSPILAVIPGQLIAYSLARERGMDPDQPPGLSKVTETW
jgi:glucosamine--fructose-6-phosphate aminotransferase (isomerizing)